MLQLEIAPRLLMTVDMLGRLMLMPSGAGQDPSAGGGPARERAVNSMQS